MRMNPEDALQAACVQWFRLQHRGLKLFAIPNGGGRSKAQAVLLKRTGVLSGVFDLFLMVRRNGYAGLWLEAKVKYFNGKKNYLSKEQQEFRNYADANGYKTAVFYTFEEFQTAITEYLT